MSLTLLRHVGAARLGALGRLARGPGPLRRCDGVAFAKLFGSGTGEGFSPWPNFSVTAALAVWASRTAADAGLRSGSFDALGARAAERADILLAPLRARGAWDGAPRFAPWPEAAAPDGGPVAVITRATVRARGARRFWSYEPAVTDAVRGAGGLLFKIGVGEAPLVRQVTFSIWSDVAAMRAFAHAPGSAHRTAASAALSEGWFREDLYARFAVLDAAGAWRGRSLAERLAADVPQDVPAAAARASSAAA